MLSLLLAALFANPPPPYPGIESWKFRDELAQPEVLQPVSTNGVAFVRGKVEGPESYRIDVAANGAVTVTTEDDEGLRRAVYYYQDRMRAGDLKTCVRKPWVRNRISRCFFGPIKRPPLNHDELMDDVDYYPEAYLDRLAHEGINGLWLTVEWRDLAATSFLPRDPNAERRLEKLRRTVARCLKYGVKTWIFCIEPKRCEESDPLYRAHPEMFGASYGTTYVMCPNHPLARQYIEESVRDIFTRVPGLGGMMMISYGERPTTCLSALDPVSEKTISRWWKSGCPRCHACEPWQIHFETASAIMRGIRAAGSSAEYVSWFYQPQVRPERARWSAEVARHLPDGVTLAYNFESGILKDQLGRFRNGGDYWLSAVGPADGFKAVADVARAASARLGAKIQVGNSHEVATVPFVPVPGLLYRKYKAMREAGVATVLQCWYFGNCPGVMNKAAGELSYETFETDEKTFLRKLAAPDWGADADRVADVWERFSDAYAQYPLSNDMQYYGPFHAGPAWPLLADVHLAPLGRTWKPHDPPSGDAIGECLENHTLAEAAILAARMAKGVVIRDAQGRDVLDVLSDKYAANPARLRDLGVIKALQCQFLSAANVFRFYLARATAIRASRAEGAFGEARAAVARMQAIVADEEKVTQRLLPLAEADSRLGFHSEAEAHQYHPKKLEWRLKELATTRARLAAIDAELAAGRPYPVSDFEKAAPVCVVGGDWCRTSNGARFRVRDVANGDLAVDVLLRRRTDTIELRTLDDLATTWYRSVLVRGDGSAAPAPQDNSVTPSHEVTDVTSSDAGKDGVRVSFVLSSLAWGASKENRPGWILARAGATIVWPARPADAPPIEGRLNIGALTPNCFGRLQRESNK